VEALLDEFHRDCFGEAAGEMRAYHDACGRYWTKPRPGRWFEGLDGLAPEAAMADVAILGEAEGHLDAAFAKSHDPKVRARIAWIRQGFDYPAAVGRAVAAARAAAGPGSALQPLRDLVTAAESADSAHAWLASEPAYAHVYYKGDRFDGKVRGWFEPAIRAAAGKAWAEIAAGRPAAAAWDAYAKESGLLALFERRGWAPDPAWGKSPCTAKPEKMERYSPPSHQGTKKTRNSLCRSLCLGALFSRFGFPGGFHARS
jgi:hypothetical protein